MATSENAAGLWRSGQFRAYLAASGFAGLSVAMQQLLVSWILIGILVLPADQVGLIQGFIGIPAVILMLIGGARADRGDAKQTLILTYAFAAIAPAYLIVIDQNHWLSVSTVALWGLAMGIAIAYSLPAQQALLNRVSGSAVQRGVSIAMAVGFIVQIIGLCIAGQMDTVGLSAVLAVQSGCLLLAAFAVSRLPANATPVTPIAQSAWRSILDGLRYTVSHRVLFHVLVITALSSLFNAGSFYTVFPFIIKRLYEGNAFTLSIMMAVFFSGAILSSVALYRCMPLRHPGRVFLWMQLSRIVVLWVLWLQPSWWLLIVATVVWGMNMGMTSTLSRSIVQESAPPQYVARVMSVFTLGLLGSVPIGAVVLGILIELVGTLNALIPAMAWSFALFIYGRFATGIWHYKSTSV